MRVSPRLRSQIYEGSKSALIPLKTQGRTERSGKDKRRKEKRKEKQRRDEVRREEELSYSIHSLPLQLFIHRSFDYNRITSPNRIIHKDHFGIYMSIYMLTVEYPLTDILGPSIISTHSTSHNDPSSFLSSRLSPS